MILILISKNLCCGCEACSNACSFDAIKMIADKEGFLYPEINKDKCTDCGLCEKVCPMREEKREDNGSELFFGAKAADDDLRYNSSSGGVFPLLALSVINDGGVVFGACLDDYGVVRHKSAATPQELKALQKTKYVQSRIGNCFKDVKELLEGGRQVLFTGTPCQCRGLQLYLNKNYDNLLVADLICYGVPSPGIWEKYTNYLGKRYGGGLSSFFFRDKRNKDKGHTVAFTVNNQEHTCHLNHDDYCRHYFRDEIIRPSCHSCIFCTPSRYSDLTMGDFWGIEKCNSDFDDNMGTSLLIVHSERGRSAWNEINSSVQYFQCSREEALQPRLCNPTKPSSKRERAMQLYRLLPFSVWIRR